MLGRPWFAAFGFLWLACTPSRGGDASRAEPEESRPRAAEDVRPSVLPVGFVAASAPAATPAAPAAEGPRPADAEATQEDGPRVYAKTRYVWIRSAPRPKAPWLGYLWVGGSVRLKSAEPVARDAGDCPAFYAVEPRGYVCVDGERATLDPGDSMFQTLRDHAPRADLDLPYHYGESLGLKRLFEVEGLEVPAWPPGIHDRRHMTVRRRSSVAWTKEIEVGGKTWLWNSDLTFTPKDKVKPYEAATFRGVHLSSEVHLPIAFFRRKPRPKYRLTDENALSKTDAVWERLEWVGLTGKSRQIGKRTYLETREDGYWVAERDAVVVRPRRSRTPWGQPIRLRDMPREEQAEAAKEEQEEKGGAARERQAKAPREEQEEKAEAARERRAEAAREEQEEPADAPQDGPADAPREEPAVAPRNTWIEIAALEGWLIAYEDDRPVFATLISAGRNGAEQPASEQPYVPPSTTPLGNYRINRKWVTKTLITPHVNDDDFIEAEVPWSQHFFDKYLLHAAYWHNNWGDGQSGGCVNLSPADAKWLFHWTEPAVPEGWHAIQVRGKEPSTRLVIHR